jgi:A118 family predicted phage portal protein
MPLPTGDMQWPPTDPTVQTAYADWDAWYSADPDRLMDRYANRGVRELPEMRPVQQRDGIWGRLARWFHGQPIPVGEKRTSLHVPLAADIARTSSELLFSEPPKLIAPEGATGTQAALDALVEGGLHPTLLEGGEICGALGGVYPRIVWDTAIADRPWIDMVAADRAVPEFAYGRLKAVMFWTVLEKDGKTVIRHLERHERGAILHGLYAGTPTQLGKALPLSARPETADLMPIVETGIKQLTAAYVPNVRPARAWRHRPKAAGLGQSDFAGIEPILDALDEVYSSWMRDIRNGKGRVIVPESMLTSNGPGQGVSFETERQIFTPLNMLARPGDSNKLDIVQFQIRVVEHRETAHELMEIAVRQAGYSGASFGLDGDGQAVTATEVKARQTRSLTTRARKALYWTPQTASITFAWLQLCASMFGVRGLDLSEPPTVEFPDGITESQGEIASALQLFTAADAMSTEVKVRAIHPEWDDKQVAAEVAAIHSERSLGPLADPAALGAGGHGLTPPGEPDGDEPPTD